MLSRPPRLGDVVTTKVVGTVAVRIKPVNAPAHYQPGPLRLGWDEDLVTDVGLRATYLGKHAVPLLYGDGGTASRSHVWLDEPVAVESAERSGWEGRLTAVEHYSVRSPAGDDLHLAILHLRCEGPDALHGYQAMVADLLRSFGREAPRLRRLVSWAFPSDWPVRRWYATTLMMSDVGAALGPPTQHPDPWTETDRMLWGTASLTPPAVFPVDETDAALLSGTVHLSATWRALVLRDGIGFVWGPPTRVDAPFQDRAEVLVRSVYTDIGILARLQREYLNSMSYRLASLDRLRARRPQVAALADAAVLLHQRVWMQDISDHGHGNALLRAAQRQLRTPELFERVAEDVRVFRAEIDSAELERARLVQEETSRRQVRLERQVKRFAGMVVGATLALGVLGINITGFTSGEGVRPVVAALLVLGAALIGYLVALIVTRTEAKTEAVAGTDQQGSDG